MTYNNAPMLTEEELDEAIKFRLHLTLLKRGSRRGAPETPYPILRTEWWETPDSRMSR